MPQKFLNDKNAIMLNVRDPKKFQEAYEHAITHQFAKKLKNDAKLKVPAAPKALAPV